MHAALGGQIAAMPLSFDVEDDHLAKMTPPEPSLRQSLLRDYRHVSGPISSGSVYRDIRAAWPYYEENYRQPLAHLLKEGRIVELGSGPGGLLAWLRHKGFSAIQGIDASQGQVDFANAHLGAGTVQFGDAVAFLRDHPRTYDLVIAKALLEHLPKDALLPLVHAMAGSLRENGIALIDVPNMDWVAASHERYLDLTHEVGFTRESLATLLRLAFDECEIAGSRIAQPTGSQRALRPLLLWLWTRALYILGEGANDTLFASRSLIAVARRPRRD